MNKWFKIQCFTDNRVSTEIDARQIEGVELISGQVSVSNNGEVARFKNPTTNEWGDNYRDGTSVTDGFLVKIKCVGYSSRAYFVPFAVEADAKEFADEISERMVCLSDWNEKFKVVGDSEFILAKGFSSAGPDGWRCKANGCQEYVIRWSAISGFGLDEGEKMVWIRFSNTTIYNSFDDLEWARRFYEYAKSVVTGFQK